MPSRDILFPFALSGAVSLPIYLFSAIVYAYLLADGRLTHFVHMFQLNSYFPSRYALYLSKNRAKIIGLKTFLPLAAYLLLLISRDFSPVAVGAVLLFITPDLFAKKTAAKKPLVYTARIKRLFAASVALLTFLLAAAYFLPACIPAAFILIDLLTPFIVLAADFLNAPFEARIRKKFYGAAKNKLAAMPDLKIIGVTGSYGKTSVKNFLNALLSAKYNVLMTPGNFNTTLGAVRTVNEMLSPLHQVFIVEMGAKKSGDIKEICDLVSPHFGVISAIGQQHLETFQSLENIINTKFELAEAVAARGGTLFLNGDDAHIKSHALAKNAIAYGTDGSCRYRAANVKHGPSGSSFDIITPNGRHTFFTKLLGAHNIVNLTGAAAVALEMGVSPEDAAVALRRIESVSHRLEIIRGDITIIDDAYNSNPAGAAAALDVLKGFEGFRILITPGMVELGAKEYEFNRDFGKKAALCADYIIFVGEKQAPPLVEGARDAGFDETKLYVAKNLEDALLRMRALKADNKVVLLENDLPDNFL